MSCVLRHLHLLHLRSLILLKRSIEWLLENSLVRCSYCLTQPLLLLARGWFVTNGEILAYIDTVLLSFNDLAQVGLVDTLLLLGHDLNVLGSVTSSELCLHVAKALPCLALLLHKLLLCQDAVLMVLVLLMLLLLMLLLLLLLVIAIALGAFVARAGPFMVAQGSIV